MPWRFVRHCLLLAEIFFLNSQIGLLLFVKKNFNIVPTTKQSVRVELTTAPTIASTSNNIVIKAEQGDAMARKRCRCSYDDAFLVEALVFFHV